LAVASQPAPGFAGLLRQLRAEAGLTQEELAEAAGLGLRTVSDLERGAHRTAHQDTARLLAGALGLDGRARELFVAAARGKASAADVLAAGQGVAGAFAASATRSLPRDIAAFTGRRAELDQITGTLAQAAAQGGVVSIHAIGGMAGVGKTTFAVHAAHRVADGFPDGQFFLPLHAHTAGQRPVDPAEALASLLLTAGVAAAQIPPDLEARAARWRDHVAGKKILLVLDDAAGHQQIRPLLPGTAGSLVLVTSRRRLTALEDAAVISLDVLPAGEAALLLARLAARPGIHAADPVVGEITRLSGYLPLAIGMLASQLRHHPARSAATLASELAEAHDRLSAMRAENLSVAAAFDLSYQDLPVDAQRLFRRLGLVPGPSVDAYAAAALDGTSPDRAGRHLGELYDQHMIAEPARGRYQMHDLLREHARTMAAADDPSDADAATGRLLDYYLYTAVDAGWHFASSTAAYRYPPPGNPPAYPPDVTTRQRAAKWLETERPNLYAAVDYCAARGPRLHAARIPAAMSGFLFDYGHWNQAAALCRIGIAAAQREGDQRSEANTLTQLGILQYLTGDYLAAATALARALGLYRDLRDAPGQADALKEMGSVYSLTGDYPAAAASHLQALAVARDLGDQLGQAAILWGLGKVQRLTGDYTAAVASLQRALTLYGDLGHRRGQADAIYGLGMVQQEIGDYTAAAASQQLALALFRDAEDRSGQAHALNHLGLVQQLTGNYPGAAASHQQALELFRDFGHRRCEAAALNNLGQLATQTADTCSARYHHAQALAIAREIGMPLEQARALEGIGRSYLQDGTCGQAAAHLRQALTIYQRIGSPAAQRVTETLLHQELLP
jgi:tetratricopeptide (TPR) repeat protein/transcriptional regulator with XRE-family HTH domain